MPRGYPDTRLRFCPVCNSPLLPRHKMFCSRKCFADALNSRHPNRNCEICSSLLTKTQDRFCSTKCRGIHDHKTWASRSEIRYCLACKKVLKPYQQQTCSVKCHGLAQSAENHPCYKGGSTTRYGYRLQSVEGNLVREHRKVMEAHLGRPLLKSEVVHHKDENPSNNNIDNLVLCASQSEHMQLHRTTIISDTQKQCSKCRTIHPLTEYYAPQLSHCKTCMRDYARERARQKAAQSR